MTWTAQPILTAVGKAAPHDCITEAQIAELTGFAPKQIEQAVLRLRKASWMEKTAQGCHRLTDAGRLAIAEGIKITSGPREWTAPKVNKDSLRIRVWRAIRQRRKFSIPEIERLVAQGGEKDIASNIRKYLHALEKAGYLIRLPKRDPGTALTSNGFVRWWLTDEKDSGPRAPIWRQKARTIYDPNTELEHPLCG